MRTHNNPKRRSSIKTRFAIKFIRAMKKLNKKIKPPSSSSSSSSSSSMAMIKYKRYHAIKAAASASMASAVGPSRAWSRALLRTHKLKHHQYSLNIKNRKQQKKRILSLMRNPSSRSEEDDLRGLVPGGQGMDICRLLNETAHYIKCLTAQVQVMTNILHHYSTT